MPAPDWDSCVPRSTHPAAVSGRVSVLAAAQRICTSTSVAELATTSKSAGDSGRNSWSLPVQIPTFDLRVESSISSENKNQKLLSIPGGGTSDAVVDAGIF